MTTAATDLLKRQNLKPTATVGALAARRGTELTLPVESRCGAVAVGLTSLFPPLSIGGAL